MRPLFCFVLCLLFTACAARSVTPLQDTTIERLHFVAWYTSKSLEVPLQGVLCLTRGTKSQWRAERLGLVLTQGRTVGMCQWSLDGVSRETSDIPGADRLLRAVERAVTTLAHLRGIEILNETSLSDCTVLERSEQGPQELRCEDSAEQVIVRVTGDQR